MYRHETNKINLITERRNSSTSLIVPFPLLLEKIYNFIKIVIHHIIFTRHVRKGKRVYIYNIRERERETCMEGKTVSRKDVTRRQFSLISWLLPLLRIMSSRSFISPSLAPPLFITISHLRSIFARFPPLPCSLYILLLVCRTAIKMITHGSETENCPRLMTVYIYIYILLEL